MTRLQGLLDRQPPELIVPEARSTIRHANVASGRRFAVLDDDPTGSQSVHDVSLVTALDRVEYERALAEPGSVAFILTNTRALDEHDAVARTTAIGADIAALEASGVGPISVVSRSDSTLRGHVIAEVRALDAVRRHADSSGYDGVLFVPAFFDAGRVTIDDVHWVVSGGDAVPAADTEFAKDATFGYRARTLPEFLVERSAGSLDPASIVSLSLDDIRRGGPDRVAHVLLSAPSGSIIVVNAAAPSDLEVVTLGLQRAEQQGHRFLHRCGPSFVRALAGIEPTAPLTIESVAPAITRPRAHGVVIVGSHVGLTTRQLAAARALGGLADVEVDASALADRGGASDEIDRAVARIATQIADADVVVATSRALVRGDDPTSSLAIGRRISDGLVAITRGVAPLEPAWVVAKGGITSHDVVQRGLDIRRGRVIGQVLPGAISVLLPEEAPTTVLGMPVVIFPGNVGGETALADTLALLRGAGQRG
ncbi:four-carbon acid sugar kinase family protein [Curtobacterium ammoniigenes]|uniref:four-carbon acid sugar kinase family protein n=1 Tax=Curtobacterium ammoniigenes TaxID=395387 RepID=UPI000A93F2DB|nr:four-carbon acid sugar kinase family protein [Curtobacterium ammoniigenes]